MSFVILTDVCYSLQLQTSQGVVFISYEQEGNCTFNIFDFILHSLYPLYSSKYEELWSQNIKNALFYCFNYFVSTESIFKNDLLCILSLKIWNMLKQLALKRMHTQYIPNILKYSKQSSSQINIKNKQNITYYFRQTKTKFLFFTESYIFVLRKWPTKVEKNWKWIWKKKKKSAFDLFRKLS